MSSAIGSAELFAKTLKSSTKKELIEIRDHANEIINDLANSAEDRLIWKRVNTLVKQQIERF